MRKGWNPAGQTGTYTVTAGAMIIPIIAHFGTAQGNSKDHFIPGNAFYDQKVQRWMAQSAQWVSSQFALVLCWELGRALQLL